MSSHWTDILIGVALLLLGWGGHTLFSHAERLAAMEVKVGELREFRTETKSKLDRMDTKLDRIEKKLDQIPRAH